MRNVRITVSRKACYEDLMARYENPIEHACDLREGQVFVAHGWQKPEGFCDSAWETISPFVMTLAHGGEDIYEGWMKNRKSALISCNDGFRPVSFLLEALPAYQYLFFDLDGTLIQSEYGIVDSVIVALEKFGIRGEDREKLKRFIGPPLFEAFSRFYQMSPEDADRAVAYYREAYEREGLYLTPLYDGIQEMLQDLAALGKRLFVVTSKPKDLADIVLRNTGIREYFEAVIGPARTERHVDKAVLIREALRVAAGASLPMNSEAGAGSAQKEAGEQGAGSVQEEDGNPESPVDAGLALMVGDRHFDVRGAAGAGVDSVGVLYGYGSREELTGAGATYLAERPGEIVNLIRQASWTEMTR